jgi:hypothetical protein
MELDPCIFHECVQYPSRGLLTPLFLPEAQLLAIVAQLSTPGILTHTSASLQRSDRTVFATQTRERLRLLYQS